MGVYVHEASTHKSGYISRGRRILEATAGSGRIYRISSFYYMRWGRSGFLESGGSEGSLVVCIQNQVE